MASGAVALIGVLVVTVGAHVVVGQRFRLYTMRVHPVGLDEVLVLAGTSGVGAVALFVAGSLLGAVATWPAVLLAWPAALVLALAGRLVVDRHRGRRVGIIGNATPVIVFGAGEAGSRLVRSMLADPAAGWHPVAVLDDDPVRRRRLAMLAGVPVRGGRDRIGAVAADTGATTLVIAVPGARAVEVEHISVAAVGSGLRVVKLPPLSTLLQPGLRDLRDIDIDDLLGRDPVQIDAAAVAARIRGRRVLVTGAGGSIGAELCRQLHRAGPAELIMLDRDESALHAVQLSLHGRALLDTPDVVLADIRDAAALDVVFTERRPEVVFHAAALKHLPMLEQYPAEAWKTNVLGTLNVLEASAAVRVECFVNISTDKAARPVSVLGESKRITERLVAHMAERTGMPYLSVRFGNVLGSRGSVLTTFTRQIAAGAPLTVTHPDVTRYFMTIREACMLVLQAAAIGRDPEVMVLDMGEPVRIVDLARRLMAIYGCAVPIVYTGLRGGEKLHEELLGPSEVDTRPRHPRISQVAVVELSAPEVEAVRAVDGDPAVAMRELVAADVPTAPSPAAAPAPLPGAALLVDSRGQGRR
ncbi:nucleoside-diphosphate sugar epimerase/dehydratase [Pseudonocardia sp. McavD-2-B]|uniref:nucleoside-diphosphate sugar epimerase/dehydratase n=1 Tax=Pseudonocardia sp. McavD-2-B TaxID=2954499 RepID=UPI002097A6DC|nr:nucleoside-diphosphate sugar epimerase/dehydratase [Pseudonocardia sp. McavD-2-B]MCO7193199.1 polysaccharide biosynthesis protein [Pseudonocardia sp. McavD-2-B]